MRSRLLLLFIALSALAFNDTARRYYFDACPTCGLSSATVRPNNILLSEWNGEAELSLNYNGKGKLQASKYSHKLLETDITLTTPPSGDDLSLDLNGRDMWFFLQEDSPHTPPNVAGSIAVYHKWKRDHVIGKINYESGKLWHFYRPEAVDAKSRRAFGTLTAVNGKLVEHFPDSYVNSAAYPMMTTLQVGYTHKGANCVDYGLAGNDLYGDIYTVTGGSGTLVDFVETMISNNDCVTFGNTVNTTFAVTPTNGGGTDPSSQTNIASSAGGTFTCDGSTHTQAFSGGAIVNGFVYLAFQQGASGCLQYYDTSHFSGGDGGGGTNTGNYAVATGLTYTAGNLGGGTMPAGMSTGSGIWYTGYFEYSNGSSPVGNPSTCFLLRVCPQ